MKRKSLNSQVQNTTVEFDSPLVGKVKTGGYFAWYISTMAFLLIGFFLYIKFRATVHTTVKKAARKTKIFNRKKSK